MTDTTYLFFPATSWKWLTANFITAYSFYLLSADPEMSQLIFIFLIFWILFLFVLFIYLIYLSYTFIYLFLFIYLVFSAICRPFRY